MHRQISRCLGISGVCTLLLTSCDPQKDCLKLFTQQGLTVLKPARDYIALGGIFVIPQHGMPAYLDPYDSLPPTTGGPNPFHSVVMQQSSSNSVGLAAAVGTLGGLVPIPAGLKFSSSKQVQLDQIDASGTRYTSQMVSALIRMSATNQAITEQLTGGNRVFVIQELYTGKSLSVKSSSSDGLAAAVEGAASIPDCSSGKTSNTAANTSDNNSTNPGSSSPATNPTSSTSSGKPASKALTPTSGTTTGGAQSGASKQNSSSTPSVGISVGACWTNAATLSFKSDSPIPFAVRLNEVVVGPGNVLQVKITNFKLPNTALGAEDVAATALINPDDPVMGEITHQSR